MDGHELDYHEKMKTPLLYLVHRIPYPPDKGDKIRSYHMLSHLAKTYDIYLGAFVDDSMDWSYQDQLETICEKTHLVQLNPSKAKLKSLIGLAKGIAMTIPYYHSNNMRQWVDSVIGKYEIKQAVVFSSAMAQYLSGKKYQGIQRIVDFVDVDSDKWAQYSKSKSWPLSFIYSREARHLLKFERKITKNFDVSYFVSESESKHFQSLAPESSEKIDFFNNGVDTEYFSAAHTLQNPFQDGRKIFTFTGAMDYWANVDAVEWFANKIFPHIIEKNSHCYFYIVGSNPTEQVKNLGKIRNIVVTGRVPDVRPYLKYTDVSVAPLRIARGVQNKVLEAMAMNCLVVATSAAAEGIKANAGTDFIVADEAEEFSRCCLHLLNSPDCHMRTAARQSILENYLWSSNLDKLLTRLRVA